MNKKAFVIDKDVFRKNLLTYTRKAFHMLPKLDKPRILDIGCGSGAPTLELARLSHGQITGVDIDQSLLEDLKRKISEAGLSDRITVLKCSVFELDFPDESFDIIWSEGSIFTIGFERGLTEWRRFLTSNGFLVVHDDIQNLTENIEQIPRCGYTLLEHFTISSDTWWTEYYAPLEKYILEIRTEYNDDPTVLLEIDKEQREIDMFKKNPGQYSSVFFVMQKTL